LSHTAEFHEDKANRKVARLRFKLIEKRQGSFDLPLGWPPAALKALRDIGYSEKEITDVGQLYLYDQVAEALRRFPAAEQRQRDKGSKVYSRKAFFAGILTNVAKGEQQSAQEEDKLLKEAAQRQQQEAEDQKMRTLQSKFGAHQRALITEALQKLPQQERDSIFQAHLTAKPEDRIMFKSGELGHAYLVLFITWLAAARPDLFAEWLPETKDRNFQSWLVWQVTSRPVS
jgi:small-conductance mechanosensitive channel